MASTRLLALIMLVMTSIATARPTDDEASPEVVATDHTRRGGEITKTLNFAKVREDKILNPKYSVIWQLCLTQLQFSSYSCQVERVTLRDTAGPTKERYCVHAVSTLQHVCASLGGTNRCTDSEEINPLIPVGYQYYSTYEDPSNCPAAKKDKYDVGLCHTAGPSWMILQEVNCYLSIAYKKLGWRGRAPVAEIFPVAWHRSGHAYNLAQRRKREAKKLRLGMSNLQQRRRRIDRSFGSTVNMYLSPPSKEKKKFRPAALYFSLGNPFARCKLGCKLGWR